MPNIWLAATAKELRNYKTTAQVAKALRRKPRAVRAVASRLNLGMKLNNRLILYSPRDVARIRAEIQDRPGRPRAR